MAQQVQIQRAEFHLAFAARQRQHLLHQVCAALDGGIHLAQARLQSLGIGFGQRQIELALEPGQRRAQLVRGVAEETPFLVHRAAHRVQQLVHGQGQRAHFERRVLDFDGAEAVRRTAVQLGLQLGQGFEPARHAGIDQQAEQAAQHQHRRQHVEHQLARNALARHQTFGNLHAHALRRVGVAIVQLQRHQAHGPAVDHRVVEHWRAHLGPAARRRQQRVADVAKYEAPRWRSDGVADRVLRVFFQNRLRRTRKIDQQAGAYGLDLACQRQHRLRQRLIDAAHRILQRDVVGQRAANQPQQQLRQQQPQQQLAPQRQSARGSPSRAGRCCRA